MTSERRVLAVAAIVFVLSTAVTIAWCRSMPAMCDMPSMRMPAASFLGMWVVMMVAMMLPSLMPMLRPYWHSGMLAAIVALAYFFVWTAIGIAAFPLGIALARVVPIVAAIIVLIAGAYQFTPWKAHALACCRPGGRASRPPATGVSPGADGSRRRAGCPTVSGETPDPRSDARSAWQHGLRLGLDCARCCGNLMLILIILGVMDLRVMAALTAAITAERIGPTGLRAARVVGVLVIVAGVFLLVRAG